MIRMKFTVSLSRLCVGRLWVPASPCPLLHKCLETADTSDHDDGTTMHFHLNISAKQRPQLMQNANVIDVPTTWHRFTGRTEPSEPAGDRPHDPSDMPDWFRNMG